MCWSSGACSLASHLAIEASGLPYTSREVDTRGDSRSPEYLALNPEGGVPALVIDGAVLTESQAILTYIGDLVPERALIPATGTMARARAHEWMNFLSSGLHVAFRQLMVPRFSGHFC